MTDSSIFTAEEFQDLLHRSTEQDRRQWQNWMAEYSGKLAGLIKVKPEERERFAAHYEGQTEPCCECGEEYPRAELVLDGHIYCGKCREAEAKANGRVVS